MKASVGIRNG